MKAVLLAGGKGTRLRPITHTGPKQLIPVANKPVIEYAIEDLKDAGITDIGVVLGDLGREALQSSLGDGSEFGVDITYILQGEPLGLAHAVGCAEEFVDGDDFVVYLGDNILRDGITALVDSFRSGEFGAGIALQRVDDPRQFGVAEVAPDGTVRRLVEKPDDPPSDLALIGVYVFSSDVFDVIETLEPSWRGELEITDAIQRLITDGHDIDSHVVDGWWKDTGKPEDIVHANRLILEDIGRDIEGTVHGGAEVLGQVRLHSSATIATDAVVRGPVVIGPDVAIESDTYVGPYTSIGAECQVADVHIENSVVMERTTISADKTITDSLIGSRTSIESAEEMVPDGTRLVVGENSKLHL